MHKRFNKFLMAAAVAVAATLPSCAVYAEGASCEQMGDYAKDMLDDTVTADDMKIKYDVLPFDVTNDLAEINELLKEVYVRVPKDQHAKVPNVIVHLCYAKRGV